MNFYKVIKDHLVIGVCKDDDFRMYQAKHRIIVISDPDHMEAIDCGGILYHDTWMAEPGFACEEASVIKITEEEYKRLKAELDTGDLPDDGSLEEEDPAEEPEIETKDEESEKVRKTSAQILQEQINIIDSQVKLAARFASV